MPRPELKGGTLWPRLQHVLVVLAAAVGAGASLMAMPGAEGALGAGLALLMVAIAVVDARDFRIPDALSATALGLALLQAARLGSGMWPATLMTALLRAAAVAAAFWLVRAAYRWLRGREGLGFGDVKLAGVAGAWLGWTTVPVAVEMAALSAIAFYALRQYGLGRRVRATGRLPFGAFLAPMIWFGWVFDTVMRGKF